VITDVADILGFVYWLKLQQHAPFLRLNLIPASDGRQMEKNYSVVPVRKS